MTVVRLAIVLAIVLCFVWHMALDDVTEVGVDVEFFYLPCYVRGGLDYRHHVHRDGLPIFGENFFDRSIVFLTFSESYFSMRARKEEVCNPDKIFFLIMLG